MNDMIIPSASDSTTSVDRSKLHDYEDFVGGRLPLRFFQRLFDFAVLTAAFVLAYLLRFDFRPEQSEITRMLVQLVLVVPMQLLILHLLGVNNFIWRFVSLREAKRILFAIGIAALPMLAARVIFPYFTELLTIPFSIILIDFGLAAVGIVGIRVVRREINEQVHRAETKGRLDKKRVLLVGAGQAGVLTLAEIKRRGDIGLNVVGFVDDDAAKLGAVVNGTKVLGSVGDLRQLVVNLNIDHVIVSISQARREQFKRILNICRSIPVKVRTIPGIYELLQGKISVSRIRDIEIGDLLGREPVDLETESIHKFLDSKVVMVTGAGGSIGSELVRQISACNIREILLVERSEFALFKIEREIAELYPETICRTLMADICDTARMTAIFRKYRPQIVFHAAAHKHVPMMEENAAEAIKNNVFGTRQVGQLAGQFEAESFVLVSTDKAVRPKSVMGATKRIAELTIQDLNRKHATKYAAVRFGNVIGSNGSVIPTFRDQILKGGPVTVTHPDMERFFMTIPEATQLVMQAGAFERGGEIFILDMGEPVKILDLAKETIRLSGLEPGVDIQISFTGMRPGEKLTEQLESDADQLSKTAHPKIFIGKISDLSTQQMNELMEALGELREEENNDRIRQVMNSFVPESRILENLNTENSENARLEHSPNLFERPSAMAANSGA